MKKLPLAAALTLLALSPALADYSPPALYDMLGSSDLVLVGTVADVEKDTFRLKVEEVVAGTVKGTSVEVMRFQDWTCAARWTPYRSGQRVLVCLARAKAKTGTVLRIRSAGGEGEMPVADGFVFYRGFPVKGLPKAKAEKVQGGTLHSQKIELKRFVQTIRDYRRCFRLKLAREGWPRLESVVQIGSDAAVADLRKSSPLAAALVTETLASHRLKKPAWTRSALLAITDACAMRYGYRPEAMSVSFDATNTAWTRYAKALGSRPRLPASLNGRSFWAVYYGPMKPQPGGDLWVFVDRESRTVLGTLQGQ